MNCMYRTLLAAVALAFSSVTASAETITVCASGCDHTSINDAIAASSDGDVIQLAAETYFEGSQIDTDGKAITLRGVLNKAGEPASVLDGASDHRVLRCQSGETAETVFENLVIQNGYSDFDGGGMYNSSSSPTLTNCTFASNSATYGGGMFNGSSSPTLSNCTFTSNLVSGTETSSGGRGGGMYNSASSPILTDCTFTINSASGGPFAGNESGRGGGMCNVDDSSPTLTNSTFTNNSASGSKVDGGSGGGMYNAQSSPSLAGCAFTSNLASGGKLGGRGGGMYNAQSIPSLTGCAFTSNLASGGQFTGGDGGGMYNSGTSPTLTNCTLCSNTPNQIGGPWDDDGSNCVMASCDDCDLPSDPCPTDLDENSLTDGGDLGAFFIFWGECQFKGCPADFNDDNVVDGIDLGILFSAWGPCQ